MEPPFTNNIVFEAAADGLGVLCVEDLAPGLSPIRNVVSSGIVLTRATASQHRDKILDSLKDVIRRRKDDVQKEVAEIELRPQHFVEYEIACANAWAGIVASVPDAKEKLIALTHRGWDLASAGTIDDRIGYFISVLLAAACNPTEMRKRDRWALQAFEPVAVVGTHWMERRKHGSFLDDQAQRCW